MIKFGVSDDRDGGLSLAEGLETARGLVAAGIDAIEVSVGIGDAVQTIKEGENERTYFRGESGLGETRRDGAGDPCRRNPQSSDGKRDRWR